MKFSDSPIDYKVLWFDKQVSKENFLNIVKIINFLEVSKDQQAFASQAGIGRVHRTWVLYRNTAFRKIPRKMKRELRLAKVQCLRSEGEFQTAGAPSCTCPPTHSTLNLKSNVLNYR